MRRHAAVLALALLTPTLRASAPRRSEDPALRLARRLLSAKVRGKLDGYGLALSELAGHLDEGIEHEELLRLVESEARPRILPLASELQGRVDDLLARPYRDREALAWVESLGADVAHLASLLHIENEGYRPYSLRLTGAFARGALRPKQKLEVRVLPREPVNDPGREAVEAESDALLTRVLPAFAGHPRLDVRRHSRADALAERHLDGAVDLGLGLELAARAGVGLREVYSRRLRELGIWVFADGRVLPRTPRGQRPGYVERHVVELLRRFDLMRRVLAAPLGKVHAGGDERRVLGGLAEAELEAAVRRLGSYLRTWERSLAILEGMAMGRTARQIADGLGLPRREVEERVALLRARVRSDHFGRYRSASRSDLARELRELRLRLRGFAVRYRQALPSSN